jgi:hypothetical protein
MKLSIKNMNPLLFFGILLIAFYFISSQNNLHEKRIEELRRTGIYTVGCVVDYHARTYATYGINQLESITFFHNLQNKIYSLESELSVPPTDGPQKGSLFMAIYLPSDPHIGGLLLDYPIKDSTDFKRYIEEFKKNPPVLK